MIIVTVTTNKTWASEAERQGRPGRPNNLQSMGKAWASR